MYTQSICALTVFLQLVDLRQDLVTPVLESIALILPGDIQLSGWHHPPLPLQQAVLPVHLPVSGQPLLAERSNKMVTIPLIVATHTVGDIPLKEIALSAGFACSKIACLAVHHFLDVIAADRAAHERHLTQARSRVLFKSIQFFTKVFLFS